jgi:hypothetical protein
MLAADHDHPGPLLGCYLGHRPSIRTPYPKVQPAAVQASYLAHARSVRCLARSLGRVWRVLCTLTSHKPANGHCHYHTDCGPDFLLATEIIQGSLLSGHYSHIERKPKPHCAMCARQVAIGTCRVDLAADQTQTQTPTSTSSSSSPTSTREHHPQPSSKSAAQAWAGDQRSGTKAPGAGELAAVVHCQYPNGSESEMQNARMTIPTRTRKQQKGEGCVLVRMVCCRM